MYWTKNEVQLFGVYNSWQNIVTQRRWQNKWWASDNGTELTLLDIHCVHGVQMIEGYGEPSSQRRRNIWERCFLNQFYIDFNITFHLGGWYF